MNDPIQYEKAVKDYAADARKAADRIGRIRQVIRKARKAIKTAIDEAVTAVRVAARKIVNVATKPL